MAIVMSWSGLQRLIETERPYLNSLYVFLFDNDYLPVAGMTLDSFHVPEDTGLAVGKNLTFDPAVLNGAGQGELNAAALTWTTTFSAGGLTVYGYFVLDVGDNAVIYAERAPAPFPVNAAGQQYGLVPRKQMDSL